jgi:hypothetical protein
MAGRASAAVAHGRLEQAVRFSAETLGRALGSLSWAGEGAWPNH